MNQRQLLGYSLVLIILGMGWSFTQPMSKLAVSEGYQHFGLIFWQAAIGAALLTVVSLIRGKSLPLGPALTIRWAVGGAGHEVRFPVNGFVFW